MSPSYLPDTEQSLSSRLSFHINKFRRYPPDLSISSDDKLVRGPEPVTPAKAGVHNYLKTLDPRLLRDDEEGQTVALYGTVK